MIRVLKSFFTIMVVAFLAAPVAAQNELTPQTPSRQLTDNELNDLLDFARRYGETLGPPPSSARPARETISLTPWEARSHIGEVAAVSCNVVQVSDSGRGTKFLNCEARFPAQPFYAVVFRDNVPKFGNIDLFVGRLVLLIGKIQEYRGRPSMVVNNPDQIRTKTQ